MIRVWAFGLGAVMILNFKDKLTKAVWNGTIGKGFPADLVRVAQRKLAMLNAAITLDALKAPPSNRLEALKGDRAGQHSIRVNDQFRVCFVWRDGHAEDVEITDCH
jgi:proteic killer suppression protein